MRLPQGRLNRSRDLRIVHRALLATGRVSWLGEPPARCPPCASSATRCTSLNRLRGLLSFRLALR